MFVAGRSDFECSTKKPPRIPLVRVVASHEVAFARMAEERLDALFVLDDALTIPYRKEIPDFAMQQRLPSMFAAKDRVEAGG
jgi:hypothetical protein